MRLATIGAVIGTATIFGLTYGLSAPLIADELSARGIPSGVIGANAAMHALGVLLVAPALPRLAAAWGPRPLMLAALALSAGLLALFSCTEALWAWFVLRLGLGAAAEVLFVCSETWTNQLCDERTRGTTMAVYTAALSLGFAGGPAILSATGAVPAAFLIGAAIALAAIVPLALPGLVRPVVEREGVGSPLRYLRLAPIALSVTLLNSGVETAGLSFLTLYAQGMGWSEAAGLRLVSTLMVGAILLQLPIGWLADRVDRLRLALWLAVAAAAGGLVWPWLFATPWLAYALIFVWGGVFVGIYTVMLALVGERFRGADLVGVYAAMGLAWGGGALLGPPLAGIAMQTAPHQGLPVSIAVACAVFACFLGWRMRRTREGA